MTVTLTTEELKAYQASVKAWADAQVHEMSSFWINEINILPASAFREDQEKREAVAARFEAAYEKCGEFPKLLPLL